MKKLLVLLILVSCSKQETIVKADEPKSDPQVKITNLAWPNQAWTDHLLREINSRKWDVKNYCKTLDVNTCIAQALSIMAKYESSFKPETKYNETGHLQGVVSRGLFQISKDSANQSQYQCNIKDVNELHDPFINITCMVKIANYWLNKDKVFFGGDKLGLGRYHSVARKSSKSYPKIIKYMDGF